MSDTVNPTPTPVATPHAKVSAASGRSVTRMVGTFVSLGDQLKSIVATSNTREELINYFLELVVVRTSALGATWIEQSGVHELQLVNSKFSNPSLETENIRNAILEASQQALESRTTTLLEPKKIRGGGVISIPVTVNEMTRGVFAFFLHDPKNNGPELTLISQLVASHFDLWRGRDHLTKMNFEVRSTAAVLELINKIEDSETTREACYTIVNQLKDLVKCDDVAIGLKKSEHRGCRLVAISSKADFDAYSETTRNFKGAFDEAVVKQSITSFPALSENTRNITLSHKKLVNHLRCESAVTIPLRNSQKEFIGGITFCGKRELLRDPSFRNLASALELPIGSSLGVVKQIEGGWIKRTMRLFVSKEQTQLLWAVGAVALLGLIAMFVPVHYRISCDCTAEPVERRFSVAPYDGLLENTFVEPGDIVARDQIIAQMDGREIRFKMAGIEADRLRAIKKRDSHSFRQEVPDMLMAEYERKGLENEAKILADRQDNLEITSPVDGIILSGSVDRKQNYPVNLGQELYEIAPLSPLRIEVAIPADEVMHAGEGDVVQIRFDGFGLDTIEGKISRIRPRSEIRNDKNVFVAEVTLDNEDKIVRPGMEGSARIIGKKHSLGWCIFHRPWERFATAIGF